MSNIDYTFVKNDKGNISLRSVVKSFGLDSVTEKDINSFYRNFSNHSYFDTGLLPVDGTGLLSIRKAANHTQFAYQIKPGVYYVNWGDYEGDSDAKAYTLAQPYRIIVADIVNDNLLGARTFYSPYPITHPDSQLYHVNLPNINCKGYRGNGVGWICLYHTHDISSYSFNEKVSHIIERCSGIEAYNDQNMSETDGPRFYQSHYSNDESYNFLWDPNEWQNRTLTEGYEWTLDPDLWIPIKVTSIDDQGAHNPNGVDFTFYMSLFGNYQAYYTDPLIPKPINILSRQDLSSSTDFVYKSFIKAYNDSRSQDSTIDTFLQTLSLREQNSLKVSPPTTLHSEDEEDSGYVICSRCESEYHQDYVTHHEGIIYCDDCFSEYFSYAEFEDKYYSSDDPGLLWVEYLETYIHKDSYSSENIISCENCSHEYFHANNYTYPKEVLPIYSVETTGATSCTSCISDDHLKTVKCALCTSFVPDPNIYYVNKYNRDDLSEPLYFCNNCYFSNAPRYMTDPDSNISFDSVVTCYCGSQHPFNDFIHLSQVIPTSLVYSIGLHNFRHFKQIHDISDLYQNQLSHDYASSDVISYNYFCPTCISELVDLSNNIKNNNSASFFSASQFLRELTSSFENIIDKYGLDSYREILTQTPSISLHRCYAIDV